MAIAAQVGRQDVRRPATDRDRDGGLERPIADPVIDQDLIIIVVGDDEVGHLPSPLTSAVVTP